MGQKPLTEEQVREAVEAMNIHGSQIKASDAIGISRGTLQNRLRRAEQWGWLGGEPLPGFEITKTTTVKDDAGNTVREFIQQKPEQDRKSFALPDGHDLKGVSALVDGNGHVVQAWYKSKQADPSIESTIETIKTALENWSPAAPHIQRPTDCDTDRLVVYVLCDWHIGLYADARETGTQNWDLKIAHDVIGSAMREVIEQSPKSHNAIVLGLGDLMHADDGRNQTPNSGNILDVDTRHHRCLETVVDMLAETCDLVARKHGSVEAVFKPGNHDPSSTVGIRQAMRMFFRDTEHVSIDTGADPFYWQRFGVNLIGGTHGDKAKIPDLPLIMANRCKEDWALTSTRHIHTGHIHHDTLQERGGVHVYSHRAPVAQDAYHASHGYLSGRSIKSFTYHSEKGCRGSTEVEIA